MLTSEVLASRGGDAHPAVETSTESIVAALDAMPKAEATTLLRKARDVTQSDAEAGKLAKGPRQALFRHAIQDDVMPNRSFHRGPVPWNGDDTTVHLGRSGAYPELIEAGASFRVVMDVADWDKSCWQNVPDQSIGSGMVPMLYSKALVEASAASRLTLFPFRPPP